MFNFSDRFIDRMCAQQRICLYSPVVAGGDPSSQAMPIPARRATPQHTGHTASRRCPCCFPGSQIIDEQPTLL